LLTRTESSAPSTSGLPGGPARQLRLVLQLREELRAKAVRYCHWKSNDMLPRSVSGENDLDLLVHRDDARRFLAVLARLGFNRALAPGGREHPGVGHFYGLDRDSGRLVHVHAHFQLVLGDDTTKNYRLPLEVAYLHSVRRDAVLPVPTAEFELALFVIRMMLKHATWDAVLMGLGRPSDGERRELAWLLERAEREETRAVVARHLCGVGVELWDRCLDSLTDATSPWRRLGLGSELLTALSPHGRRSRLADAATRIMRRGLWGWTRFVLRRPTRKRFERTGLTVAIVGGDGAGKTTATEGVAAWLGSTFVVRRTHLGNPRPSLLTLAVKGPLYVARAAGLLPSTRKSVDPRTATPQDFPGAVWALWHVLTARDRLREYHALRRVADAGGVVVSDRWPLPQLHLMDGSRVAWILDGTGPRARLVRRLAEAERRIYAHIGLPDVLVVLRLDPDVAVARRPEDDADYVRSRNAEVFDVDWSATPAVVLDATQHPDQVLAGIRNAIWERL
jgi:thymidylate kinase